MSDKIRRKILVVDDEITVCKSIRMAILCDEYEIDTALSGEEALEKSREQSYELVITDLMMPGISGMDLLSALQKLNPDIRIIMVTGYPTIKTAVQSIKLGAFDYIPKPFTPNELRGLVSRAFKAADREDAAATGSEAGGIPPDLYYIIGHTWLRIEGKNTGYIGVMDEYLKSVGKIILFEFPEPNKTVSQGEMCAKISDDQGFSYGIWSPASGKILKINEKLKENYGLLKRSPYQKGWIFRIELTNIEEDKQGLIYNG